MQTFDTSYSYDRISLKLYFDDIIIVKLPLVLQKMPFLLVVSNDLDSDIVQIEAEWNGPVKIKIGHLLDGIYYVNIYTKTHIEDEYYWPYLQKRSLSLLVKNGIKHFVSSEIINDNRKIISGIKISATSIERYLRPTKLCQSHSTTIIALSKLITKFCVTPMQKLLAIHDWIAENIYYDYDDLESRECDKKAYSALEVLFSKRCVCRGYANLGVALMRACGIPSIGLTCYSLNITTDGGWNRPENNVDVPNHIITAAYVNERWVYMDITWDSDNEYREKCFKKKRGVGISRKYFDTTLEMISNTHRFMYVNDA